MKITRKNLKLGWKFCVNGSLGVMAYYVTFYLLNELAHVWYVVSALVAFMLNCAINFYRHKFSTFENKCMATIHRQAALYLAMSAVILPVNALLLYVLVEHARLDKYMVAQPILTVFFTIIGGILTHKIFTPKTPSASN